MNLLIIIVLIAVAVLLLALKAKQAQTVDELAFVPVGALFTPAERSFLGVLEQALDNGYRVFGKVRLGDIIKPATGQTASNRTTAQNKINQKHVDFVICSVANLAVVGVIELDDRSHARDNRAERDDFVDRVLAMAGIPVVHFPARQGYSVQQLRARLAEVLPASEKPAAITEKQEEADSSQQVIAVTPQNSTVPSETVAPVCPKCTAEMVKRQAVKGVHAGKWFWACSAFPKCRQVVAIESI